MLLLANTEETNTSTMQLTCVLNAMKRQLFPGHMHRGKYRYVRPVKLKEMNLLRAEFERSERVMKLLINPYLTQVSGVQMVLARLVLVIPMEFQSFSYEFS